MIDTTIQNIEEPQSAFSMTDSLERLWLLCAIREGLDQIERGDRVLADSALFDAIDARICNLSTVIEA